MVRPIVWFIFLMVSVLPLRAGTIKVPDYQPGDTAIEEVATPISLIVIDPKATDALRQKEAQRVPAIFRFDPAAVEAADSALRRTFTNTHNRFMKEIKSAFHKNKLADQDFASPQFIELTNVFQTKNKSFPLAADLALLWAKGESDHSIQNELIKKLRVSMSRYLLGAALTGEARIGPVLTQVIPVSTNDQTLTLEMVEQRSLRVSKTNLITVAKARIEAQQNLSPELQPFAKFLGASIKANCVFDPDLTQQSRAKKTDPLWAADHYEPGQLIVKKGQMIDAKTKAALDQLKSRIAVDQLQEQLSQDKSKAQAAIQELQAKASTAQMQAQMTRERGLWLAAGLSLILFATLVAIWRLRRVKPSLALATIPSNHPEGEMSWQQSSSKADAATVKAGLIPHLARLLKDKFVLRLVSSRETLLDTQQAATMEIASLEERLEKVQAPLEERLKAYETRITELEKELAVKGEENRELIKAKILLAKKQLEAERARNRLPWN
jgi:7TM-HD extracellular